MTRLVIGASRKPGQSTHRALPFGRDKLRVQARFLRRTAQLAVLRVHTRAVEHPWPPLSEFGRNCAEVSSLVLAERSGQWRSPVSALLSEALSVALGWKNPTRKKQRPPEGGLMNQVLTGTCAVLIFGGP